MRKTLVTLALALIALAPVAQAQDDVNGVMLEAWYWDSPPGQEWYNLLSRKMPQFRQWGITALWLPPTCKGAGGGFSSGYDIYDFYDIGGKDQKGTVPTKWGTKTELLKAVAVAHANGLDCYADIVANHRSGGEQGGYSYQNLVGSEGVGRFTMAPWDFHPKDWHGDWYEAVAGLADIAQEVPYVRDNLFSWIRWFDKQTGVDGYRLDAVKHMKPEFTEGLLYQVQEGMGQHRFAVGEFYDGNPNTLQWWVNANHRRSSLFDFTLFFQLLSMAHGNGYYDMRGLRNRFQDDRMSVTFCNNHDTFRRANGLHLYIRANLAYAFIMAAPGYPSIYWEDLFDDQGNARDYMTNLIWIHHMLARGSAIERWADEDLYVLEREGNLLAGYNDDTGQWKSAWVRTSFGANVRLHDYAGDVGDVWTNQDGWARISVPPSGYVMYGRDGMQNKQPAMPARRTTQEFEGAPDMDLHPAAETWSEPIKIAVEAGKPINVDLWLKDTSLNAHVALFDDQGNRLNHARGRGHVWFGFASPAKSGWYQVRVGLERGQGGKKSNYFLKLDYQGPRQDPGREPQTPTFQTLPLLPSSIGP
ncbi:MAG: alpha-amylase domain-containing protein [Planctomycetota bacterium]